MVMQWTSKKCTKKHDAWAELLFCFLTLFLLSLWWLLLVPGNFVVPATRIIFKWPQ